MTPDELRADAETRRGLRAAGRRYEPSAQLRGRLERRLRGRRRAAVGSWALGVACAAIVALVVVNLVTARRAAAPDLGALVDAHLTALASVQALDVVSSDRHTVKPWFEGKLGFAVTVPAANPNFKLLGARLAYFDRRPGAELLFQYREHRLSVFEFREGDAARGFADAAEERRWGSFWIATWRAGGLRYCVVGGTSAANVAALAAVMRP